MCFVGIGEALLQVTGKPVKEADEKPAGSEAAAIVQHKPAAAKRAAPALKHQPAARSMAVKRQVRWLPARATSPVVCHVYCLTRCISCC